MGEHDAERTDVASGIGAAWDRVQAAMPEGWILYDLSRYGYDRDCTTEWLLDSWTASAGRWSQTPREGFSAVESAVGGGDTESAALVGLAELLERRLQR